MGSGMGKGLRLDAMGMAMFAHAWHLVSCRPLVRSGSQTYRVYWPTRRQRAQLKQLVGSSCDQTIIKSWEWVGLRWRNECESDGVVVGVGLKQRVEAKRDKTRDETQGAVLLCRFLLVVTIPTIGEGAVQMSGKPVRLPSGSHLLSRYRSGK
jgi:hypothetical protein